MSQWARRLKVRGVSLVELVVVIAVIGMMVLLIVPAVGRARETARRVDCQANLSQFGKALSEFAVEHDGSYSTNLVGLSNYIACDPKVFYCKSDRARVPTTNYSEIGVAPEDKDGKKLCSYQFITNMSRASYSKFPVLFDKNGTNGRPAGRVTSAVEGFGGNHQNVGGNVLYVDSSVAWVRRADWSATNAWGGMSETNIDKHCVGY